MAKRIAKVVGTTWMALVVALGFWLGFREGVLHEPGIFFEGGYGEIYLLAAIGFPGYALLRWSEKHAHG